MNKVRVFFGALDVTDPIEGGYTFTTDLDLSVGDVVEVEPTKSGFGKRRTATVVGLGSDYAGSLKRVVGIIRRARQ